MTTVRAPEPGERLASFEELLAGAQAHDPWAFRQLYESLAGAVCGYLRSRGAREPEDLTSEVFIRVFEHVGSFRGNEANLRSWVFTIAHRILIDEHRRSARRPLTVDAPLSLADGLTSGGVHGEGSKEFEGHDAGRLLARLPPEQCDVLTLRVVADLSIDQVARVLRKRPGAVKALQHRGLANLRRLLSEEICND